MPKGIPNKKPEETNGEQISKMEAMRRALAKKGFDCKPAEYQSYIKSKFVSVRRIHLAVFGSIGAKRGVPWPDPPMFPSRTAGWNSFVVGSARKPPFVRFASVIESARPASSLGAVC